MIRTTTNQIYDNLLLGVQKQLASQNTANTAIASGRRFQSPSDAPLDYKISMDMRHVKDTTTGSITGANTAIRKLETSGSQLSSMEGLMRRASELSVTMANGTVSSINRTAAAKEVSKLQQEMTRIVNAKFEGEFIFSGTRIDKAPITLDALGNATYNGDSNSRNAIINVNQKMPTSVTADKQAFVDAFNGLKQLGDALAINDSAGIQNSQTALNNGLNGIIDLNSEIGARITTVNLMLDNFNNINSSIDNQISKHEDVDMAKMAIELQKTSLAMQAAYSQISKVNSLSLLNFLR